MREAQLKAGIVLLEPIMNVVVNAPGQYHGDLIRYISRRRGEILDSSLDSGRTGVQAQVEHLLNGCDKAFANVSGSFIIHDGC